MYVHIPFCASRCGYCAFATWTDRQHLVDVYLDACITDIERRVGDGHLTVATTVFFGGGTPSLLTATQLSRVLDRIPRTGTAEVTVECNPDSVDLAKLRGYATAGVNRLSFGVQSMQPHVLTYLDRTHEPANVTRSVEWARAAGFHDVNLDLIYGAPNESLGDWEATLVAALVLEPTHVSAYALTIEQGTPLDHKIALYHALAPDDDDQAEKYALADERLTAAGLGWYEISNWARPGHQCRHNELYWAQGDYLGIGCAAHGHRAGRRSWNVRVPERYVERIRAGAAPEAGAEVLDPITRRDEALGLALRTRAGALVPPAAQPVIDDLLENRLVTRHRDRLVLTRAGRLVGNEVTTRLLHLLWSPPQAPAPPAFGMAKPHRTPSPPVGTR